MRHQLRHLLLVPVITAGLLSLSPAMPAAGAERQQVVLQTLQRSETNAMFQYSIRRWPQAVQTFRVNDATPVSALAVLPVAVTYTPLEYMSTPPDARHSMEDVQFNGTHEARAGLSVYRVPDGATLSATFSTDGLPRVADGSSAAPIRLGAEYIVDLSGPVTLMPGTYVAVFDWTIPDRRIVTLWINGQESGNNTQGGYNQNLPNACEYVRTPDAYPAGAAYRTEPVGPIADGVDVYGGPTTTFTQHKAKVRQCIETGKFIDVFNPGDLQLMVYGPPTPATVTPTNGLSAKAPIKYVACKSKATGRITKVPTTRCPKGFGKVPR